MSSPPQPNAGPVLSGEQQTLAERGVPVLHAPVPLPPGSGAMPPGDGMFIFPHFQQFQAAWNTAGARSYRWTFDEALKHSRENALAYRRDPVVYEALRARQMPTAGLEWHLQARNEDDPGDMDHAKRCREAIEDTPGLQQLQMMLLEALWYGRYGAQLTYKWDWSAGYRRAVVDQFFPVNGDKLVFRYTGEVGILVGASFPGTWMPTDRGRAHICTPDERQTLIVHEHEREDADYTQADMAGRVHGVGVRDRLYWFLYMKQRVLAWMMEFLERVGAGGVMVFFFESGNNASMLEVKEAAEKMNKNTAFLFPRYADGKTGPGFQRIEPSMAGVELLRELVTTYFDQIIRRLILGQSLSAEATGTGLGSGVAAFHQETLNRILKYDARNLQETLTRDFVSTISRCIDPSRRPPKWVYEVDKPNAAEHLEAAMRFFDMGGSIDEDNLRSVLGLPKPKPGVPILAKLDPMNPQMGVPGMAGPGAMGMAGGGGQLVPGGPMPGYNPAQDPIMAALFGMGRV